MDEFLKLLEKNWSLIQENESDNVFALLFEYFYTQLLIEDDPSFHSLITQFEIGLKACEEENPKLLALSRSHGENFAYDVFKLVSHFMVSMRQLKSSDSPFVNDAVALQLTQLYLGIFNFQGNTDIDKETIIKKRYRKLSTKFHPDRLTNDKQLNWLEENDGAFGSGKSFQLLENCKQLFELQTPEDWQVYLKARHPQLLSFFRENRSNSSGKKVRQAFMACLLHSLSSSGENSYAIQTQACLLKQCLSSPYCKAALENCNLNLDFVLAEIDKQSKLCIKIFNQYSEALQTFYPELNRAIQQAYNENNHKTFDNELILTTEQTLFFPLSNALTTEERGIPYNLALLQLLFKPRNQYQRSEHVNWLTQVVSESKLCDWLDNFAKQIKAKKSEKLYTDIKPNNLESIIKEKKEQAATLTEKLFLSSFLDILQNFQQSSNITEKFLSPTLSKIIPFLTASISTMVLVTIYSNEIALLYSISYLCLRSRNSALQNLGKNLALLTSSGLLLSFDFPLRTITSLNTTINVTTTASQRLLQFHSPQQQAIPRDKITGCLNLYPYKNSIITTIARPLEEYVRHIQEDQYFSSWRLGGIKADKIKTTINSIRKIDANSEVLLGDKLNLIEKQLRKDLVEDKTIYKSTAKETIDLSLELLIKSKKALKKELDSIVESGLSLIQYKPKPRSELSDRLSESATTVEYSL